VSPVEVLVGVVGQFLELSIAARPLASSYEFYRALGFTSLPVSDSLPDPYLVLFDGNVAIGLHDREQDGACLTFVRPGLQDYVRALRRLGVDMTFTHLTDNEFNRVGFADPTGQSIALLEARTFPPGDWNRQNVSACGEFLEYSLPTESLSASREFWQSLGFTTKASGTAPHAWERLSGHGLTIGLHETHFRPGLAFRSPHLEARLAYLGAKGISARHGNPIADKAQASAMLAAPEGTVIYLFESGAQ
jgi:catechol 2,3-dioxygenase-like lactoylglutathione lyase family enzyme